MSASWESGSDSRWRRFRRSILDRDRWKCTLREPCCTSVATQVHHVIPLSRGGAKYDPANCVAACKPCNLAIGDRMPAPQPQPRKVTRW